jgi:hypothetical protein
VKSPRLLLILAGLLCSVVAAHAQFSWTGLDPAGDDISNGGNWLGGAAPTFSGTEDLVFGKAINNQVNLSSDIAVNSISLTGTDDYRFTSGSAQTITIGNGGGSGIYGSLAGTGNILLFDTSIDFTATGTLTIDPGNSTVAIAGKINGSMDVVLTNLSGGTGSIIFNDTCTGSTYTGNTTITGIAGTPVVVAFWNTHPFGDGTGTLTIQNDAQLISHGSETVANPIVFDTTVANDPILFKSWDDTLYFSNNVTLANNTLLSATRSTQGLQSQYITGVYPLPGPMTRHPIEFDGDISGSYALTLNGGGVFVLTGNNTYTNGTTVNGSVVFGYSGSNPGIALVSGTGYAGDALPGDIASFLTHINGATSTGAVGFDTLPTDPINTFSDNIDLSSFSNSSIRIGSATSAILTGTITPQGTNYQFGNGGGTLYVQSALTGSRAVTMNNSSSVPLTLYLQEGTAPTANTYTTGTLATNGFIIFDGLYSLPGGANSLTASGSNNSYIGYTDMAGTGGTAVASPSAFLALFNKGATNGIIGFDTNATTLQTAPVNYNTAIDLSTFNNGVFLGTATGAILSGALTPTPDGILRLTATHGATLEVDSALAGSLALVLGTTGFDAIYNDGTIYLPNANTFTGGTTLNSTTGGITVEVGDNAALGSGTITMPQGTIAALSASTYSIALPNPIVFSAGATPGQLFVTGNNGIELDGAISGPGSISVMDPSYTSLTLGTDNTFSGGINLYNATLYLNSDYAAGTGTINFLNNSTLNFYSASPVIYGLNGEYGSINLNPGQSLTIDASNAANNYKFGGHIGNEGSVNATLTVTSTVGGDTLYLYGTNNYSGGTFIGTGNTDLAAVAIGNNQALGTGTVTLNTAGPMSGQTGALAVNAGVTFSNDLVFTGGSLQGFGTFAPNSVNGTMGAPLVFGTNQGVVAGVFGLGNKATPGTLTLATGADFANGGAMLWLLQDGLRADGHSTLVVDGGTGGNLNISATSGQFTLYLASLNASGTPGSASNLNFGVNNQFIFATTTNGASITNFNAADFTVNTGLFADTLTSVFVSSDGTNLFINFTPVPEPSTYALLGLGLGAVLFPALRRRKRA